MSARCSSPRLKFSFFLPSGAALAKREEATRGPENPLLKKQGKGAGRVQVKQQCALAREVR
jgi:hypothetical protein